MADIHSTDDMLDKFEYHLIEGNKKKVTAELNQYINEGWIMGETNVLSYAGQITWCILLVRRVQQN